MLRYGQNYCYIIYSLQLNLIYFDTKNLTPKKLTFYHFANSMHVTICIVQDAISWVSIPSCSSGFLVITFYWLRKGVMYHKPNIWFINTHTKCYCSTHHLGDRMLKEHHTSFICHYFLVCNSFSHKGIPKIWKQTNFCNAKKTGNILLT